MRDYNAFKDNVLAALERVAGDAAIAADAEAALWCITRTLPSLLGNPDAARRPGALPEGAAAASAATVFLVTPDRQFHIIAAPVNFQPEQYHERVPITLGHPGHVAATRRGAMLADTGHHQSFVKILQTFRAASAMQVPLLWKGDYLGVLICANAARGPTKRSTIAPARRSRGSLPRSGWRMTGPNGSRPLITTGCRCDRLAPSKEVGPRRSMPITSDGRSRAWPPRR